MTRLFTEGFEMGDNLAFDITTPTLTAVSVRSGNYAARNTGVISIASKTELYVRVGLYSSNTSGLYDHRVYFYEDSDLILHFRRIYPYIHAYVDGVKVADGTLNIPTSQWFLFECHVKLADSGGVLQTKINGIPDIDYTGDTNPSTYSGFNRVGFKAEVVSYYDDIAINDTNGSEDNSWCGDGHIIAIKPNANGDQSDLTNSGGDSVNNYTYVDDIPSDGDSTYVWSDTATDFDLYNLTAPSLPVNHRITRIYAEARAKDPDTGDIKLIIKPDSTVYKDSAATTLTTSYSAIKGDEYTENPDDGNAWEESDLDDLQAGVEIQ